MNNEQHINETESETRMIAADVRNDVPVWLENEDGSGQWSDGWTGAYEDLPIEDRSMDVFAPGVIDESDIPF